jgi:inosose dehydratase
VDFPTIKKELENLGFGGWIVVEPNVLTGLGKPKESAKRNREYLMSIGYK